MTTNLNAIILLPYNNNDTQMTYSCRKTVSSCLRLTVAHISYMQAVFRRTVQLTSCFQIKPNHQEYTSYRGSAMSADMIQCHQTRALSSHLFQGMYRTLRGCLPPRWCNPRKIVKFQTKFGAIWCILMTNMRFSSLHLCERKHCHNVWQWYSILIWDQRSNSLWNWSSLTPRPSFSPTQWAIRAYGPLTLHSSSKSATPKHRPIIWRPLVPICRIDG